MNSATSGGRCKDRINIQEEGQHCHSSISYIRYSVPLKNNTERKQISLVVLLLLAFRSLLGVLNKHKEK